MYAFEKIKSNEVFFHPVLYLHLFLDIKLRNTSKSGWWVGNLPYDDTNTLYLPMCHMTHMAHIMYSYGSLFSV